MTNVEKLDKKLEELRERGVTGTSVTIGDTNVSMEDFARDMLVMLEAMNDATPMAENERFKII